MFKTIRLGRLFGTDVFAHWTLWPLFAYLLAIGLLTGGADGLWGTGVLLVSLFLAVYLHELGHALVAGLRGVRTRDIVLLPIGGIARLERQTLEPSVELQVAAAGPLANLALASISLVPLIVRGTAGEVVGPWFDSSWLVTWVQINLILGIGNLLPALPLDGGRVVRAMLTKRHGYLAATATVVRITRYVGFATIVLAPFTYWLLVLFGSFLLLVSVQEMLTARFREMASSRPGTGDWQRVFNQPRGPAADELEHRDGEKTVDAVQVRKL